MASKEDASLLHSDIANSLHSFCHLILDKIGRSVRIFCGNWRKRIQCNIVHCELTVLTYVIARVSARLLTCAPQRVSVFEVILHFGVRNCKRRNTVSGAKVRTTAHCVRPTLIAVNRIGTRNLRHPNGAQRPLRSCVAMRSPVAITDT